MFWRKRRKIQEHRYLLGIDIESKFMFGDYGLGKSVRKMCEDFLEKDGCEKITVSVYFGGHLFDTITLKKEADI